MPLELAPLDAMGRPGVTQSGFGWYYCSWNCVDAAVIPKMGGRVMNAAGNNAV